MTTTAELRQLEAGDGPFYVENIGPTQFSLRESIAKNEVNIELGPAGTDASIGVVPKEAFQSQGFRRAIIKGYLNVTTDGAIMDRLSDQIDALAQADEARRKALMGMMEESNATKDLIPGTCLEAGCESPTIQTVEQKNTGTPPLCPIHASRVNDYIPTQVGAGQWTFTKKSVGIENIIV